MGTPQPDSRGKTIHQPKTLLANTNGHKHNF